MLSHASSPSTSRWPLWLLHSSTLKNLARMRRLVCEGSDHSIEPSVPQPVIVIAWGVLAPLHPVAPGHVSSSTPVLARPRTWRRGGNGGNGAPAATAAVAQTRFARR